MGLLAGSLERVGDLDITLGEPWMVHRVPDGTIHGQPKVYALADGTLLFYYSTVGDLLKVSRRCLRSRDRGKTWAPEPVRLECPEGILSFPNGSLVEFERELEKVSDGVFDLALPSNASICLARVTCVLRRFPSWIWGVARSWVSSRISTGRNPPPSKDESFVQPPRTWGDPGICAPLLRQDPISRPKVSWNQPLPFWLTGLCCA